MSKKAEVAPEEPQGLSLAEIEAALEAKETVRVRLVINGEPTYTNFTFRPPTLAQMGEIQAYTATTMRHSLMTDEKGEPVLKDGKEQFDISDWDAGVHMSALMGMSLKACIEEPISEALAAHIVLNNPKSPCLTRAMDLCGLNRKDLLGVDELPLE